MFLHKKKGKQTLKNLLQDSKTTTEFLKALYSKFKQEHRSPSLENFSRKLNISSKGYLSKVLNAKAILAEKYIANIAKVYSLSEAEQEILTLMCKLEKKKSEFIEVDLETELAISKKAYRTESLKKAQENSYYSAFLYNLIYVHAPIRKEDLALNFPLFDQVLIEQALESLIALDFIIEIKEELVINQKKDFFFEASQDSLEKMKELTEQNFALSQKYLVKNEFHSDQCYFEASSVTIKKESYKDWLKTVRRELERLQISTQEDENPNGTIAVNIQVYPLDF